MIASGERIFKVCQVVFNYTLYKTFWNIKITIFSLYNSNIDYYIVSGKVIHKIIYIYVNIFLYETGSPCFSGLKKLLSQIRKKDHYIGTLFLKTYQISLFTII